MRRFIALSSSTKAFFLSQGATSFWFSGVLIVNLTQYNSGEKVGSSLFFLTVQQLIALAGWNTYKFARVIKKYCQTDDESELEREIKAIKFDPSILGGVILADSYEVTGLYLGLLRSNIPFSLLFHVSPTLVSVINLYKTGSTEAEIRGWVDYIRKAAILAGYNTAAGLLTVLFNYTKLENPDTGEHSVYPGFTDWDTKPVPATICFLGVVFGCSLLMPLVGHGIMKGIQRLARAGKITSEVKQPLLNAGRSEAGDLKISDDSPLSAVLPTPSREPELQGLSIGTPLPYHSPIFPITQSPASLSQDFPSTPSISSIRISSSDNSANGPENEARSGYPILSCVIGIFTSCRKQRKVVVSPSDRQISTPS